MSCDTPEQKDLFAEFSEPEVNGSSKPNSRSARSKESKALEVELASPGFTWTGEQQYLTVKQVANYFGVSVPTIWRWVQPGTSNFPNPVRMSQGVTRWRIQDLRAYECHISNCGCEK